MKNSKENIMNWEWTEATNEEFESRRKNETYYRIYYVDKKTKKEHNVYKFWAEDAENDIDAISVWNQWCKDHADGKKYFWATSGYYMAEGNDKRYDTMEEMHDEWKNTSYDNADRKYDEENVKSFFERHGENVDILESLKKQAENIIKEIRNVEKTIVKSKTEKEKIDFNKDPENKIKALTHKLYKLDDKIYEFKNTERVLRTKHFCDESWNLIYHVLEDLKYNLEIMTKDNIGYPTCFIKKAADELGIECGKYYNIENKKESKNVSKLAAKMWKDELKKELDNICGWIFFSEYGIVDEKDLILKKYEKEHKSELPYKLGMDKGLDYKKLHEISNEKWNAIWDWMKIYGQNLWN